MKHAKHHLQIQLVEDIQANLGGLSEKYTRQLRKPLLKAVRKLSHKFGKLLAESQRARTRREARAAAKFLMARLKQAYKRRLPSAAPAAPAGKMAAAA